MAIMVVSAAAEKCIQPSTQSSLEVALTTLLMIYCVRFHVTAPIQNVETNSF